MNKEQLIATGIGIRNAVSSFKTSFAKAIRDKDIPLEERWELYKSMPEYFKEHHDYIVHFKSLDLDAVMYEGWMLHVERRETVYADRIVQALLDTERHYDNDKYFKDGKLNEEGRKLYDALREEILETNLGSYIYDW